MQRILLLTLFIGGGLVGACTGGAAGDPDDDFGDLTVLTHSPANGEQLDAEDSLDGFNALNSPALRNPGAVTIIFSTSVTPESVINGDPADPQGTRNVRLFYFDPTQGPFDPTQPTVPGVNPPGANVLIEASTVLTTTNAEDDTIVIRPSGISTSSPLRPGQYSVTIEQGVQGADGDGMKGAEYFFFFRVGQDNLGPVVVTAQPAPGERDVDPFTEIRINMSETIQANTVSDQTMSVTYQPAGAVTPIIVPGVWFVDGGNGPGNNFPAIQLDQSGNAGFSGTSPRNGADLVFRPDTTGFPANMLAGSPPCQPNDPPEKGNRGLPLGQAITVSFVAVGVGVTDTAGNRVPTGSPNTTYTFQTKPLPDPVFAPNTNSAIYYGDTVGVGVIEVDPARTPYRIGPNPVRLPNSVVTSGEGAAQRVVRTPIPDLVDMTTDTRPYTSFYSFACATAGAGSLFMGNLYAASASTGGGQVVVIDTYGMKPLGRFGTPSPGGIALTAVGQQAGNGRMVVSNFSANTVTMFDISNVRWFTGATLWATQAALQTAVQQGSAQLILNEDDFEAVFPAQRQDLTSRAGPPVIGTLNAGISPSKVRITGLPGSMGTAPILNQNTIICTLNAGESTADFAEATNLNPSAAVDPVLRGVNLSSRPTDVVWSPWSSTTGSYYFYIAGVGGSIELFATGFLGTQPSVRPEASTNFGPNKIINNIGGFSQPTSMQWITSGNGVPTNFVYTHSVLVAETGENRVQQIAVTAEVPSNLFQVINANHVAGLGPVDITGDPAAVRFPSPTFPRFTTYYVANAGEGTVRTASYQGGVIGQTVPVPGVLQVVSWWSR